MSKALIVKTVADRIPLPLFASQVNDLLEFFSLGEAKDCVCSVVEPVKPLPPEKMFVVAIFET